MHFHLRIPKYFWKKVFSFLYNFSKSITFFLLNTNSHTQLYGCSTASRQQRSLLTETLDYQMLINAKELEEEAVFPKPCTLWSLYKMINNIMHSLRLSHLPPTRHTLGKKFPE